MSGLHTKSEMSEIQFLFTADVVKSVAEPFLKLHFGERCSEYEHGCECCQRWAALDRMLVFQEQNESLRQEIQTLETQLKWRRELLAKMTANEHQVDEH